MDPATNEIMKMGLAIDHSFARVMAIILIIGGPIVVALSQVGLAIREIAINSRKEYDSNQSDYESLKWVGLAFCYIGWLMIPAGIILALRSL